MAAIGSGFECVFIQRNTTSIKVVLNLMKSFVRLDARWDRLWEEYVQLTWGLTADCRVFNMQIAGSGTEVKIALK